MEAQNGRRSTRKARWSSGPMKRLPLIVIVALVAAALLPARLVQATATWQTAPPLPAARYVLAATTAADGTLYAIGGVDNSFNPQSTVYSFKPGTDTAWQTAPSLPAARFGLAATTGADGTLYAIGGYNGGTQSTVYSFKPGTDATAPTTSITLSPAQPGGQNKWYTGAVTVSVSAADPDNAASALTTRCVLDPAQAPASFSDLPTGSCVYAASGGASVSTEGTHTVYAASEDPAGNVETTVHSTTFQIDSTPPQISCGGADSLWHGSNVTVPCSASDATSGLASSPDSYFTLTTSVAPGTETTSASTGTHQVCDQAGNCATAGPIGPFKVDLQAASVSCGSADGLWHAADVSIGCTASDGGSGLATSADAGFNLSTTVAAGTETGNASTGTHQVCDQVGNCTTAGPVGGNMVDKKAPSITLTAPTDSFFTLGQAVTVGFTCSDGGSGIQGCGTSAISPCTATTAPSGDPASLTKTATVPTGSVGAQSLTAYAADAVCNASNTAIAYSVHYAWSGFSQPINDPAAGSTPMSVFKAGSTVPVKFQLKTASGAVVQAGSLPTFSVTPLQACSTGTVDESTSTVTADSASTYRWDSTAQQYIYNYKTPSAGSGMCQSIQATLDDGTTQTVYVGYR